MKKDYIKARLLFISTAIGFILIPTSLFAHHNFRAEFDENLPIEVTGTVTSFVMTNPHARFYVDAEDENGEVIHWDFELAAASSLLRRGWRKDTLKQGDIVTVIGARAKNNPHVGNARTVTLSDGENVLSFGSPRE